MKNENQCDACGEILSNNDHATRHASECVVMNSGKNKYCAVGSNPVGKPNDKSYFPNVFYSFSDADYFIRNMRKYVKNFHYFVEACEVKQCKKCSGRGINYDPSDKGKVEVCSNCYGKGVVKL